MDIILDSNIYRADISLRSKDFDILIDYLHRTNSSLIIPEIILDEIIGLYRRTVMERSQELNKTITNWNLILIDQDRHIVLPELQIVEEVNKYKRHILERLEVKAQNILPYNNDLLPIISKRAIDRKKPSGEKGQGFRDTLIWLTMLDYCKKNNDKQIIFISSNTDDFSNSLKQSLHESLNEECKNLQIRVNYYKNLREFIEEYSSKIEFLSLEWIQQNLDMRLVEELLMDDLNGRENRSIISYFQDVTGGECTSYNVESVEANEIKEMFIYEMIDNKLIVNLTVNLNLEIVSAITFDDSFEDEYTYIKSSYDENLEIEADISFQVVDEEIANIALSGIDF